MERSGHCGPNSVTSAALGASSFESATRNGLPQLAHRAIGLDSYSAHRSTLNPQALMRWRNDPGEQYRRTAQNADCHNLSPNDRGGVLCRTGDAPRAC